MKKAICTTTIHSPTEAICKFIKIAKRDGWHIYIAGDKKTPHSVYFELQANNYDYVTYLSPTHQSEMAPELSRLIGWNCIQRRNFAMLKAYRDGAEVFALIDDDNIPLPAWGQNLAIGREVYAKIYHANGLPAFDPLQCQDGMWHRGFPIQLINPHMKTDAMLHYELRSPLVQADLWDGEPDVDAISRIAAGGSFNVMFEFSDFFAGEVAGPFNSQNTFIHRSILPIYFLFPHIGRMDDIWTSYITQRVFPNSVVYGVASVYQRRNTHDLVKDLEAEILGYRHTLDLVKWLAEHDPINEPLPKFFPKRASAAWGRWREAIND